jgi:hypothetical protein
MEIASFLGASALGDVGAGDGCIFASHHCMVAASDLRIFNTERGAFGFGFSVFCR